MKTMRPSHLYQKNGPSAAQMPPIIPQAMVNLRKEVFSVGYPSHFSTYAVLYYGILSAFLHSSLPINVGDAYALSPVVVGTLNIRLFRSSLYGSRIG